MAATEFELLGEQKDEFEDEAAELEPFFSRGKSTPAPRSMPRADYLSDLEDELEDEALELEPLIRRRDGSELEVPTLAQRPAPNAVDPDAAEPIFTGRVRMPEAPLLDPSTLKLSSRWNQATHPKVLGNHAGRLACTARTIHRSCGIGRPCAAGQRGRGHPHRFRRGDAGDAALSPVPAQDLPHADYR